MNKHVDQRITHASLRITRTPSVLDIVFYSRLEPSPTNLTISHGPSRLLQKVFDTIPQTMLLILTINIVKILLDLRTNMTLTTIIITKITFIYLIA